MDTRTDVLVIGGSPGGVMAAMSAARYNPDMRVMLVKREDDSIVPCGIPYIFGTLHAVEKDLAALGPLRQLGVKVVVATVTEVDKDAHTATLDDGPTIHWRKLILATGSSPVIPDIPNIGLANIFTINKSFDYLADLFENELGRPRRLVILGGGFIGIEFCDECRKAGHEVAVVEMNKHCLERNLDPHICQRIERKLHERGVKVFTGTEVTRFHGHQRVEFVELGDGTMVPADIVLVAVGQRRNSELAQSIGLSMKAFGSIWVDNFQCTSHPDIFAVGDCSHKQDFFSRRGIHTLLASVAAAEGRIAGRNLFTRQSLRFNSGTISIYATCLDDLAFGIAGLTESAAREAGLNVVMGEATLPDRHPPTMPGMTMMTCLLTFCAQGGTLVGGQVVGGPTTGEVLNAIGIAIQSKLTADELLSFQFGSHPRLTAPVHPIVAATEDALQHWGMVRTPLERCA